MAESTQVLAAAVSSAVTGPDTPNAITTSRPAKEAIWVLLIAMWSMQGIAIGVVVIIGAALYLGLWPDAMKDGLAKGLVWIALAALAFGGLVSVGLISSRIGQVKASAGPVNVDLTGTAT